MDILKIKLDCEKWTNYINLMNKSGKLQCPECKDHVIDVEQTLNMVFNTEIIRRKKIEIALDENIKQDLMVRLDTMFSVIINKIDIKCEYIIKEVNDYREKMIQELSEKRRELEDEIEKIDCETLRKESFENEIKKRENLPEIIDIEERYEKEIEKRNKMNREIIEKIKHNELKLESSELDKETIKELVGKLKKTNDKRGNLYKFRTKKF